MPWDWPVEVNYHEAKAFCNWKAADNGQPFRLPTEDEWYRLYDVAGFRKSLTRNRPPPISIWTIGPPAVP